MWHLFRHSAKKVKQFIFFLIIHFAQFVQCWFGPKRCFAAAELGRVAAAGQTMGRAAFVVTAGLLRTMGRAEFVVPAGILRTMGRAAFVVTAGILRTMGRAASPVNAQCHPRSSSHQSHSWLSSVVVVERFASGCAAVADWGSSTAPDRLGKHSRFA